MNPPPPPRRHTLWQGIVTSSSQEQSITNPAYSPWLTTPDRQPTSLPPQHERQKHPHINRSDSHETDSTSPEPDSDARARCRVKNRAAAARSRAKKKAYISDTESVVKRLQGENTALKSTLMELRNAVSGLRHCALQHTPAVGECRCVAIHRYNLLKADEIVSSMISGGGKGM